MDLKNRNKMSILSSWFPEVWSVIGVVWHLSYQAHVPQRIVCHHQRTIVHSPTCYKRDHQKYSQ